MPDKTLLKLSRESAGLEKPHENPSQEFAADSTDMIGMLFEDSHPSTTIEDSVEYKEAVPVVKNPLDIPVHTEDVPGVSIQVEAPSEPTEKFTIGELADRVLRNINRPDSEKLLSDLARTRIADSGPSQVG